MRKVISGVAIALLPVGAVVGAAELQGPEVTARPIDTPGFFVTNDELHPVPVAEQGTVNVNVVNSAVPVQVAESRRPLQKAINTTNFGTERFHAFHVAVPPGKMLVVETVTMSAVVEPGQKVRATVSFQSQGGGNPEFGVAEHVLTFERVEGFGPGDYFEKTQSIVGYAAGDQGVIAQVERDSATGVGGRIEFSVSGYLIDLPTDEAR